MTPHLPTSSAGGTTGLALAVGAVPGFAGTAEAVGGLAGAAGALAVVTGAVIGAGAAFNTGPAFVAEENKRHND